MQKLCTYCGIERPLQDFLRRTGKRSGKLSRRGACRDCRKERKAQSAGEPAAAAPDLAAAHAPAPRAVQAPRVARLSAAAEPSAAPKRLTKRPLPVPPPRPEGPDASVLRLNRKGFVMMRGRTDKGSRWFQETDLETAVVLVREHAAVVVNRHTIRRIYTNKSFRSYLLERDRRTCFYCGEYGDTIDHLLPRSKGGHTTPVNCVIACNLCNQSKASLSVDEFLESAEE